MTDEALVAAMAGGDPWALAAFMHRWQPRVHGLALRVVADPGLAEEVTQDAFVRVWRRAASFDPQRGRVVSWLLTITRNLAIDALRLRRDPPIDPALAAMLGGSAPDAGYHIETTTQLGQLPTDSVGRGSRRPRSTRGIKVRALKAATLAATVNSSCAPLAK